jgi:hypothetical protein
MKIKSVVNLGRTKFYVGTLFKPDIGTVKISIFSTYGKGFFPPKENKKCNKVTI